MRTLVLNAGYEPLHLVSWQKAICLVFLGKAEVVAEYESYARSAHSSYQMPSVVRLVKYIQAMKHIGKVRCTRKNLFLRDDNICQYCGIKCTQKNITVDHVVPRSKGGPHTWENLVTSCQQCNISKSNKLLNQARMKLLRPPTRPRRRDLIKMVDSSAFRDWLGDY